MTARRSCKATNAATPPGRPRAHLAAACHHHAALHRGVHPMRVAGRHLLRDARAEPGVCVQRPVRWARRRPRRAAPEAMPGRRFALEAGSTKQVPSAPFLAVSAPPAADASCALTCQPLALPGGGLGPPGVRDQAAQHHTLRLAAAGRIKGLRAGAQRDVRSAPWRSVPCGVQVGQMFVGTTWAGYAPRVGAVVGVTPSAVDCPRVTLVLRASA